MTHPAPIGDPGYVNKSATSPPSELVEAARGLEEQLEHFAKLARIVEKEPLNSRRSLERAGESLSKVAESDHALNAAMQKLMTALTALRQRHMAQVAAVERRSEVIRERSEQYGRLLERMASLGLVAGEVNAAMGAVVAANPDKSALAGEMESVLEKMAELISASEALEKEAEAQSFEDVGKEAGALRGSLAKGRQKLVQLRKDLAH